MSFTLWERETETDSSCAWWNDAGLLAYQDKISASYIWVILINLTIKAHRVANSTSAFAHKQILCCEWDPNIMLSEMMSIFV